MLTKYFPPAAFSRTRSMFHNEIFNEFLAPLVRQCIHELGTFFGILNTKRNSWNNLRCVAFNGELHEWEGPKADGTRETIYLWIGYSVNNCKIQLHSSWVIGIVSHSFNSSSLALYHSHIHRRYPEIRCHYRCCCCCCGCYSCCAALLMHSSFGQCSSIYVIAFVSAKLMRAKKNILTHTLSANGTKHTGVVDS